MKNIFDALKAEPSTNNKKKIIEENKNNELFKKVLIMALDSSIVFDVKKLPQYTPNKVSTCTLEDALNRLKAIYKRTYTGYAALDYIKDILEEVSQDDAEVLTKVLLKDLDCGVQEKIVNAVIPHLIKDEPYMRCSLVSAKTIPNIESFETDGYAVSEVKMDGQYLNNTVVNGSTLHTSRNGKVYDFHGLLDEDFIAIAKYIQENDVRFSSGVVFMGEGNVLDEDGSILPRETGNGIIQKAGKNTITYKEAMNVIAVLWDVVPLDKFLERTWDVPRKERRSIVENAIAAVKCSKVRMVEYKKVKNIDEAFEYNAEVMDDGQEGTILKCESGIWKSHTSPKQLKMKLEIEVDMKIVGFNEGKKKRAGMLGSLILESSCGKLTVNCGTGIKEKDHEWTFQSIWDKKDELLNKIITVKSNELTKDKKTLRRKLFLPVFVEFRFDKDTADSYERILEIRKSAVEVLKKSLLDSHSKKIPKNKK